jgi:hypothetical protein
VGAEHAHVLPARLAQADVHGRRRDAPGIGQHAHPRVRRGQLGEDARRAVGGPPVHGQDLDVEVAALAEQRAHRVGDERRLVEDGQNDGNPLARRRDARPRRD